MIASRLYPFLGAAALMVIAVALGGCASPQNSQWTQTEAPNTLTVSYVRLTHSIAFRGNDERLSPAEADRLATFLKRENVGYGDRISVIGGDGALDRRRQDAIAAVLRRQYIQVDRGMPVEGLAVAPGEVRILVGRHVVTPPACPNWSKPSGADFANQPHSNFGCSTTANLGLMVADPGDLVGGRPTGPADGEAAAWTVERYRQGRFPELLKGDAQPNRRSDVSKGQPSGGQQ